MAGWSDLAVRARATSVVASAVLYRAHAVLTRGRAVTTDGRLWIAGKDGNVGRYVRSDANRARVAHLIAGWKQDASAAGAGAGAAAVAAARLSTNDLATAYMGHKPHWWTFGSHGYSVLPDAIGGLDAIPFWRDVCASLCIRRHGDDVELVEVDLRNGLFEGHRSNVAPSTCDCYAHVDTTDTSTAAAHHRTPSQAAPNDFAVLRFLETASLVDHYIGTDEHDNGLHYRKFVNLYAVQRHEWASHFVDTQQSSVFYARALEPGYILVNEAVGADMGNIYVYKAGGVATREACLRECALHGGSDDPDILRKRQAVKTMVHQRSMGACICTTTDWLDPQYDDLLEHDLDDADDPPEVYRVQFCAGVAGGSSRSVVYRKQTNASADPLPVCHGMPVGAGMILSNGSIFFSEDPGSVTRPVDLQCRAACDANPDCAIAHSMIETFEYHQLAHAKPPPPLSLIHILTLPTKA